VLNGLGIVPSKIVGLAHLSSELLALLAMAGMGLQVEVRNFGRSGLPTLLVAVLSILMLGVVGIMILAILGIK
jgi:uncharacterized membrane protein YadS